MRDDSLGQIWFTPSPAPVTQTEFIQMLESELGQKVKPQVAGVGMMRFLGLFNPMMRETVEMMYEWTQPFIMDSSKAEEAFGLQGTPLPQAIRETVAWLRKDMA